MLVDNICMQKCAKSKEIGLLLLPRYFTCWHLCLNIGHFMPLDNSSIDNACIEINIHGQPLALLIVNCLSKKIVCRLFKYYF